MITLDIAIVTHNGGEMLVDCISSIHENASVFTRIWLFDNGSTDPKTLHAFDYCLHRPPGRPGIDKYLRSETNEGFIVPNNRIEEDSDFEFLCLLNDDTEVHEGWELPLLGTLLGEPNVGAVGYSGGVLDPLTCVGAMSGAVGDLVDYVEGWCLMLSPEGRRVARETGGGTLFDETNLSFAYGEDSDLCLRLREAGMGVVALPQGEQYGLPQFVEHKRGQTTGRVLADGGETAARLKAAFDANHKYLRGRWGGYLAEHGAMATLRKQGYTL